jgi:hypothetical protein
MKKSFFFLTFLAVAILSLQSCKKEASFESEQNTAESIVAHNDLTEVAEAEIDEAIPDNFSGQTADDRGCATVTYAQPKGTWPNVITIDYGTGCTQPGGLTFKGKIIVNQSDAMINTGATRVLTFDNFFIENVQISGSKTLTNQGLNANGDPYFTKTGEETLTFPDGSTATRTINHVRTMVEGYGTNPKSDNVWEITGTDTGTNRMGDPYTVTITEALVKKFTCPWLVSGVIEMTVNNKTRSLDFGDGTCERDATLTLADGTEKEIKIRRRWWK